MALTPCPVSRLLRTVDEFDEIPNIDANGAPIGGSLWREKATGKIFTARDHPPGGTVSSTTKHLTDAAPVLEVPEEDQVYECSICISVPQRAMTLVPCGHSFCAQCVKSHIQHGGIHCSYCRTPFEQCIPNYALRRAGKELENQPAVVEAEAWLLARPAGNRVIIRDALIREAWLLTLYRVAFNVQTPDAYLCVMPMEIRGENEPRLHLLLSQEGDYRPLESSFADTYRAYVRAHGQEPFMTNNSKGDRMPIAGLGTLLAAAILLDDHNVLSSAGNNDTGRIVKLAVGDRTMSAARDSPLMMTDLSEVERKGFIQTLLHAFQELRPHVLQAWHAGAVPDDTPAVGVTRAGLADISDRILKRLSNTVGLYAHVLDHAVVSEWETQVDLIAREIVDDPQVALRVTADVENLESQFASLRGFVTQEAVASRVAQANVSSTFQVPLEPNMIGRSSELLTLHRSLKANGGSVISQAIAGMGGIGKTTLAAKYCSTAATGGYIEGEKLSYSHVAWLRAEDGSDLKAQLATLLKLWFNMAVPSDAEVGDIFWESLRAQSWKVLLVFDNIPTLELLSDLLPSVNASRPFTCHVSIIATTRDMTQHSTSLQLETFTLGITAQFVAANFDGPIDDALVKQLHEIMAGLPLALIQTAAYVRTTGHSLADTLLLFAASQSELLFYGTLADGTHPRTIGTLISLAIAHLHAIDEVAVDVLACAAFFPPDRTRKKVYREVLHTDIDASAATLQSLGLIKESRDMISIHRLVQVCVRQTLRSRGRAAVEAYFCGRDHETHPSGMYDIVRITEFYLSLPHQPSESTARMARWTRYVCEYCLGDHDRALAHAIYGLRFAIGVSVNTSISLEELFTIAETKLCQPGVLQDLCFTLSYGTNARWLAVVERLLPIAERHFPEMIPFILNRGALLACRLDEYNVSLAYLRRVVIAMEGKCVDLADRSAALINQGILLSKMGFTADGESLQLAGLRAIDEECVANSLPVASALRGILHTRTNFEQQKIKERVIQIREATEYGYEGHIDDLDDLAATYAKNGEFVKACVSRERVLALRVQSVGEDSIEILPDLQKLANQYENAEQWTDSLHVRLRILKFQERTGNCAEKARAQIDVGRMYGVTGDHVQELEYLERALTTREAYLGPDHALICDTLREIGNICHREGMFQRALECHQRSVDIYERLSMPQRLLANLRELCNILIVLTRYDDARGVSVRGLKIAHDIFKPPHIEISKARAWLALCCCNLADEDGEYDLLVAILRDAVFEDGLDHAKHLAHFAVVCDHRNDAQKAREIFSESLRLFEECFESDFPHVMIRERLAATSHPNTRKREYFIGLAQASEQQYGKGHPTSIALRAAAEDIAVYPLTQFDLRPYAVLPWATHVALPTRDPLTVTTNSTGIAARRKFVVATKSPGRDTVPTGRTKPAAATNAPINDVEDGKGKFVFSTKWPGFTGKK